MKKFKKLFPVILTLTLSLTACSLNDTLSSQEKNKIIEETNSILKETADFERKNAEQNEKSLSRNNIELNKDLKSISINSNLSEIKIFKSTTNTNSIELDKNNYNLEEGQTLKIEQKNSSNILAENKITIYLSTDLEKLDIKTKDSDIKIFDVNLDTVNIDNYIGETKLFNSQSKNINLHGGTREILIDNQTSLENLNINGNNSDIKLFDVNTELLNIRGVDHRILFTNTYSTKIILDTQKSSFEGSLLSKGNKYTFQKKKEDVLTTPHSIYIDKSNNDSFNIELK